MIQILTDRQAEAMMKSGDIDPALLSAKGGTALILTQSWCPQWRYMKSYLEGLPLPAEAAVLAFEYDRSPLFREFMAFKESAFKNFQVPYCRFYLNGRFAMDSNSIEKARFLKILETGRG
jgi:hypothetical protein